MCMSVSASRGQKRVLNFLELELQAVVSHLAWETDFDPL